MYFAGEFTLEVHKVTHLAGDTGKPFKCSICNEGFAEAEDVREHRKEHFKDMEHYRCPSCQEMFKRFVSSLKVCKLLNKNLVRRSTVNQLQIE